MTCTLENESYEVYLCDEHAETATMGAVNNKVKEIRDKLRNALQLAKDLGITIPEMSEMGELTPAPTASTPAPVVSTPPAVVSTPVAPTAQILPEATDQNIIKREAKPIQVSEGESINQDTNIELQTINAKGGQVVLPKHTSGDSGETDIHIIETTDSMLQERTKMGAAAAEQGMQQGSYSSPCLACKGTGTNPVLKSTCPKCKGSGVR